MNNRLKDPAKLEQIKLAVDQFAVNVRPLPGLTNEARKQTLAAQIVDSIRRGDYLRLISARSRSPALYTPYSGSFEPMGGAAALHKAGQTDEAYWLVYLATHCGKHKADGWNLTEDIYGRFGQGGVWDWASVSQNSDAISVWLDQNYPHVTSAGRKRRFGNHRKFETLKPGSKGTGFALKTYIEWVMRHGSHAALIADAHSKVGQNPQEVFRYLYEGLEDVAKLGRLGKFDLLCNLSNLMIAPIFPNRAYIEEATGPLTGAQLLFGNGFSAMQLDAASTELSAHLDVSPQVVEDALCNWQKSPHAYIYFRG